MVSIFSRSWIHARDSRIRRPLVKGLILTSAVIVAAQGVGVLQSPAVEAASTWTSGMSYSSNISGFGAWRGNPVTIYGCWADSNDANQRNPYCLQNDNNFTGDADIAVGLIVSGESMSAAASGAYEARWRQMAVGIRNAWGKKRTVYIRPAHELNGEWEPWFVTKSNYADFRKAWVRYATIVKTELKDKGYNAKMELSYNYNFKPNLNGASADEIYPGDDYVDVIGVDKYDAYYGTNPPTCHNTEVRWNEFMAASNHSGEMGFPAWQAFAKSHGKPLSIPEWGLSDKNVCDNPLWMQKMNDFLKANNGTGPGQVLFDIYFNESGYGNCVRIYPVNQCPNGAAKYQSLKWGTGGSDLGTATPVVTPSTVVTPKPATPTPSPGGNLPGDFNNDGRVNISDLSILLKNWTG